MSPLPQLTDLYGLGGEIHVYGLSLPLFPSDSIPRLLSLLDDDERERAARIRHPATQHSYTVVRACLRALLGRYLSIDPRSIRFVLGEKGKPRLAGTDPDQGLVFNVSHSGECGLIAFATNTALGVDVERQRMMTDMEGIAQRCFSASEQAFWMALPPEHRLEAFYTLWCCKEAFVKGTGQGIALGLESCVVRMDCQPRLVSIPEGYGLPDEWRLMGIDVPQGHCAEICYRGSERKLRHTDGAMLVNTLFNFAI